MSSADLVYSLAKEHLVRASSQMSFLMPNATDIGIGVKGLDNRYQMINRTMETLFGKSAEQVAGRADSDLFPPDVATQIQRTDQNIIDGAVVASEELDMSIDGVSTRCLWLAFPLLASDGRLHFIGTVVVDISRTEDIAEMRHSLEQLREANRGLQKDLAELDRLASTDKLTGAWNRRRLEETVISEMDRLKRYDHPLSALIIDIDFFKRINDEHGHVAGDQVLVELAAVIRPALRVTDSLTRWGGVKSLSF